MSYVTSSLHERLGRLVDKAASTAYRARQVGATVTLAEDPAALTCHLGLLLAGATPEALRGVSLSAIGYGSEVTVRDRGSDVEETYVLMNGSAMDLDAGHISIESPLGRALLGRTTDDSVEVRTPGGHRYFRIVEVTTLIDLLTEAEASFDPMPQSRRKMGGA